MKFTFACKKITLNDSIKEYAEKKIAKLDKYFPQEADAFVTFAVEKKNRCVVELTIRTANGTLFRAQEEDPDGDMRGAIDAAVTFIDRRIRKNKTRLAKNLRPEALQSEALNPIESVWDYSKFELKRMIIDTKDELIDKSIKLFNEITSGDSLYKTTIGRFFPMLL